MPDGSCRFPDGSAQLPSGAVKVPGLAGLYFPDGSISLANGDIQLPSGEVSTPNVEVPDGAVKFPDGSFKLGDDVYLPSGSVMLGSGKMKLPNGKIGKPKWGLPKFCMPSLGFKGSLPKVSIPKGSLLLPSGQVKLPDGRLISAGDWDFGFIETSMWYNRAKSALDIEVYQAVGLPKADLTGSIDAYAKLRFEPAIEGVTKLKTKVKKNTYSPKWNQSFSVKAPKPEFEARTLSCELWDWDRFSSNDPVAKVDFDLADLDFTGKKQWHPLQFFDMKMRAPKPSADGSLTLPDMSVQTPTGSRRGLDSSVKFPDGSIKLPDGSLQMPDGSIKGKGDLDFKLPDGAVELEDGSYQLPSGEIMLPSGNLVTPSGSWAQT
jgi:hypothetical protein